MNSIPYSCADFIIVGATTGENQVMILASTELSAVELEAERDEIEVWGSPFSVPLPMRYMLTAELRKYVLVRAETYGQAFSTLFREWTPQPARKALGGRVTALDAL